MNKALINFLCCFIPSKEKRKDFRKKHALKNKPVPIVGSRCNMVQDGQSIKDEKTAYYEKNNVEIHEEDKKGINLKIDGENNHIVTLWCF